MMGRALAAYLARHNRVYGVSRFTEAGIRKRLEDASVECIKFDLRTDDLVGLPQDVDTLMHYAVFWQADADPAQALELNGYVLGRMLETFPRLEQIVVASTVAVYVGAGRYDLTEASKPIASSMYGASKLVGDCLATHVARRRNLRGAILRYWFPYSDDPGPATNYYHGLVRRLQRGEPFYVDPGDPGQQQPLFIDDIVAIAERAVEHAGAEPLLLNVAGAQMLTHGQVIQTMADVFGCEADVRPDAGQRPTLLSGSYDLTRLKQSVGLGSVTFRQGLTRLRDRMSPDPPSRGSGKE